jgi:glycosyltransferase involved in cell wall biosynthesis
MSGKEPLTIGVAGPVDLVRLSGLLKTYDPATKGLGSPLITDLVLSLLGRGHRVRVFTLSTNRGDLGDYVGDGLSLHVRRYRERGRWLDGFRAERRLLASAMGRYECDVIHAHWTYELALAALASDTPSLVTVHDWGPEVLRHHRHPYRVVRLLMQAQVLRKAPFLTANSPYIAEKIEKWYQRAVPIVPNGIVVRDQLPRAHGGELRTIGSVNNGFGKLKNVTVLLEAFAQLRHNCPGAMLRLVGSDYQPGGPAHEWAQERALDVGVEFVGPIPSSEVPAFMQSIDVLVHPSLEESFGMTLLEAIIQGTPVIAGEQSGAVPWVLGYGDAGTLVDVSDPDAICQAILDLLGDPAELDDLRHRALDHTREQFSLDRVVDQYEQLYCDVLARGKQ